MSKSSKNLEIPEQTKSYVKFAEEIEWLNLLLKYIQLSDLSKGEKFKERLIEHYKSQKTPQSAKFAKLLQSKYLFEEIVDLNKIELYHNQMAFTRIMDNALNYFRDVLLEVIYERIELLNSNELKSVEYILSFESYSDLITDIAEKKIHSLFYGNIDEVEKFFKSKLNIELFDNKSIELEFKSNIAARNTIVHNRGVINEKLSKVNPKYFGHEGKYLFISFDILNDLEKSIVSFIRKLDQKLMDKFNLIGYGVVVPPDVEN